MTSDTPGPTGDEVPRAGEATIPAGQKHIAATTAGGRRTSLFAVLKGGPLKTAAELATILSLVVAIIAVVQASDSPTSTPATAPGQEPTVTSPEILFDNFSGSEIDPSKWETPTRKERADLSYVQDGKLHLKVTQQDGQGRLAANLRAKLQGDITDVRFEMTLTSREGKNTGGGYANVFSQDGRQHKLALKAGDESPRLNYFICKNAACDKATYGDFEHPYRPFVRVGETYRAHIYQDDQGWIFDVEGFRPIPAPDEDGPIDSLEFSIFSHGDPFHVTVDNVRVTYA